MSRQKEAIASYLELAHTYPQLFAPRAFRRIITDRKRLEEYAAAHNVLLGVAAQTSYVYFLLDLLEMNDKNGQPMQFPHFRLVYRKQLDGAVNTVVVGMIANPALGPVGGIVLLRQERHATGQIHLELPRGFGETNLSGEENALQELREETGFIGEKAFLLGKTYTDTGAMDAKVSFYHVPITEQVKAEPNTVEAIKEILVLSLDKVWAKIRTGEISDGFTLQALAFLQHVPVQTENRAVAQLQTTPV